MIESEALRGPSQVVQAEGTQRHSFSRSGRKSGAAYGSSLEDFTIKRCLYAGRKSRVWCAVSRDGQRVALKGYLRAELTESDSVKVDRELSLVTHLEHPHIVRGLCTFSDELGVYLVQEMASRGDLCDVVRAFEKRCIPEVIFPILRALSYLHDLKIIHRDVKSENIVVTSDGAVKLCDFGLAIDCKVDCPVSRVGTLEFMAPEIVRLKSRSPEELAHLRRARQPLYGSSVDIWATGCVAYELLYGVPLFRGDSTAAVERRILYQPVAFFPRVSAALAPVSSSATNFLSMALVANPSLRATAEELLRYGWVVEPKDAAAAAGAHQRRAGRTASVPSTILAAPAPARQPVEGEEDAGAPRPGSSRDTTGVSEVGAALAAAGLQEGFQEALGRRPPPMPVPEGQEGGGGGSSRPGTPPQNERTRGDQMDVSADSSADGSADHARLVPDHPGLCGPGCPCCRPGAGASAHDILVGQQRAREQRQQHEKQIKREQLYQQERGRQREEQRVQRATASQSAQLQPAPQPSPADGLRGSLDLRAPVRAEKRRGSADRRGSGPEEFVSAWRTANSHRRIGHDAQQQQQQSPEERSDRSQAPPRHEQPPPEKEDSLGSQPPAQKVGRWGRVRRSLSHFSAYIPRLGVDYLWGEGGGRRRRGSGSSGSSGSASGSSSSSSHERGRRAVGDE